MRDTLRRPDLRHMEYGMRQMRTFPMRETPHNYSTCREPSTRRTCLAIQLAGTAGSVCSDIC
jgi:hypothetical protein